MTDNIEYMSIPISGNELEPIPDRESVFAPSIFFGKTPSTYTMLRNNVATNILTKIETNKEKYDFNTGVLVIELDPLTVILEEYGDGRELRQSTAMLFDLLTVELTRTGAKELSITLDFDDYMRKCGLSDPKSAREQVRADLRTLHNISLSIAKSALTKNKQKTGEYLFHILRKAFYDDKIISVKFDEDFLSIMADSPVMSIDLALFKVDKRRNPNAYYLGRKAHEHKNMNIGKRNEDIIAVKTLLRWCPKIPTYEEVKAGNRHYTDRIIEPFERDMKSLSNIFTWEYCHKNGTPLTDDEQEILDYDTFIKLNVRLFWLDYPDQTQRLETKKKKEKAEKRKQARKEKKEAERARQGRLV